MANKQYKTYYDLLFEINKCMIDPCKDQEALTLAREITGGLLLLHEKALNKKGA